MLPIFHQLEFLIENMFGVLDYFKLGHDYNTIHPRQ